MDANIFVNTEIEMNKLRFRAPDEDGRSKCHSLQIGKKKMKSHDFQWEILCSKWQKYNEY